MVAEHLGREGAADGMTIMTFQPLSGTHPRCVVTVSGRLLVTLHLPAHACYPSLTTWLFPSLPPGNGHVQHKVCKYDVQYGVKCCGTFT